VQRRPGGAGVAGALTSASASRMTSPAIAKIPAGKASHPSMAASPNGPAKPIVSTLQVIIPATMATPPPMPVIARPTRRTTRNDSLSGTVGYACWSMLGRYRHSHTPATTHKRGP
jgi:hypothetical protein